MVFNSLSALYSPPLSQPPSTLHLTYKKNICFWFFFFLLITDYGLVQLHGLLEPWRKKKKKLREKRKGQSVVSRN